MISCVVVAAGKSRRFGMDKLFSDISGKPLIWHTVDSFIRNERIDEIILVSSNENIAAMTELFDDCEKVHVTLGGDTRMQSVIMGLRMVDRRSQLVAIHDGARPYTSQKLINKLISQAEKLGSAVPYLPSSETAYLKNDGAKPIVLDRDRLVTVQTPQIFGLRELMVAYQSFEGEATDDSKVYLQAYGKLNLVEGEAVNKKITYAADLTSIKVGCGIDVHPLVEGRELILGGVKVPYLFGLDGHSDADVLVHAVMDALLSAVGERDIGVQFPDTDPQYRGISSLALLYKVCRILESKRLTTVNVSAVIVCQAPKLQPYIPQMAENIASILKISPKYVNISATTTEKLGMIGKGDGIAVQAYVLVNG